jgi:hypothetical protein
MALHLAMAMIFIYRTSAIIINQALQIFLIAIISKIDLTQITNNLIQHSVELQMAIISA